jgi:DNA-binding HxlR family transcriptional regulator
VVDFRYAQFCPLTRAVEILGERWTILIVRELFLGPKRFSDLKAALNGVSPSVLADRLARLEEKRIVAKRDLPPPAASIVYELDEAGRALGPLLVEMTRWGVRFLGSPDPSDAFRPEWLLLGLQVFARTGPSENIAAHFHIDGDDESVDLYVAGGDGGTVVSRAPIATDVRVSAPPMEMLMFASGQIAPGEAGAPAVLEYDGDLRIVRRIPALFDFRRASDEGARAIAATIPNPPAAERGRKTAARSGKSPAKRRRQGASRP